MDTKMKLAFLMFIQLQVVIIEMVSTFDFVLVFPYERRRCSYFIRKASLRCDRPVAYVNAYVAFNTTTTTMLCFFVWWKVDVNRNEPVM
jgi:hypothetical protein